MQSLNARKPEFKPKKNYMFRLSPEKLDEIKRGKCYFHYSHWFISLAVFDVYDTDYDGLMDICHIGELMRVVGLYPSEKDIADMVKELDNNKEGKISLGAVFIHVARCFRDIGEIETSTKNSLKKLSHEIESRGEKVRLISTHNLSSTISDQVGEPLTEEETDDFIKSIPKRMHSLEGDIKLDEFVDYLMSDNAMLKSSKSTTFVSTNSLRSFQ